MTPEGVRQLMAMYSPEMQSESNSRLRREYSTYQAMCLVLLPQYLPLAIFLSFYAILFSRVI